MLFSRASEALKFHLTPWITGRGFFAIAAVAAVLGLLARFALAPVYRDLTGFLPFDLQVPLSRFMIGVELGAFDGASAISAYVIFAAIHFAFGIAVAALFTLLWAWLFSLTSSRVFAFLKRGGILMVPWYVVIVDLLGKVGFYRLLGGLQWPAYALTIELCAPLHRFKFAMADIRNYVTIAFVLIVVVDIVRRRNAREDRPDSSFTS